METNRRCDAELVARTLAGEREAFGQLFDRHAGAVRAVVLAVSGDWSAVEDLSQECFLHGYRKLATLDDAEKFRAWIVGIARHVARQRRRTLHRDRHEFGDSHTAELASAADHPEDAADREQVEWLRREVTQLGERERLAIHAFYFQSQDANQAAELLGVSRSGFYAILKRAVARLAARVRPFAEKER